jgi:OOP family OmpA-OmpF porin
MLYNKYLPLLLWVMLSFSAMAQTAKTPFHQRWEVGLQAGVSQGQTDFVDFGINELNPGGGLLLRYHLDDIAALRLNVLYAEISGDDAQDTKFAPRGFSFSAPLTEASLMFELDLLGKRRWDEKDSFKKIISPYIFGGAGYAFTKPYTNYNEANNTPIRDAINLDKLHMYDGHFVVPMGVGIKADLNENWVIGVEAGVRLLFNDYLDGVSNSGNPRKNDTYTLTSVTATYRLAYVADRDHDGISDSEDACPDVKGPAKTGGCPDADGDGIADYLDACPEIKGNRNSGGCPDTDSDGIADKNDQCPDQKGTAATGGCPDKDKDGIADGNDGCPDVYGPAKLKGCPDSDDDGTSDADDACPDRAGSVENRGCPVDDRDRDGVVDTDDRCPDIAGSLSFSGCPDTDKDGIGDNTDKCPEIAGPPSNSGCPVMTETDKKILEDATYGVQFESRKSTITTNSLTILDKVADVLNRYPAYSLTISGHTDSAGSDASNQKLSEKRAKACFDYLASKKISAQRMQFTGLGESQPIADNATPAGKIKNRRVEFVMQLK